MGYPIVETEFAKELVKELKQARVLAQKVGDLVMLKTAPRFRLDRSFKGSFVVETVTPTNAVIQLKDDAHAELINVSRQRLSKCNREIGHSTP